MTNLVFHSWFSVFPFLQWIYQYLPPIFFTADNSYCHWPPNSVIHTRDASTSTDKINSRELPGKLASTDCTKCIPLISGVLSGWISHITDSITNRFNPRWMRLWITLFNENGNTFKLGVIGGSALCSSMPGEDVQCPD